MTDNVQLRLLAYDQIQTTSFATLYSWAILYADSNLVVMFYHACCSWFT